MQALLTVLINPRPGRDAPFDDWYSHVHVRDVMRFPGAIRVQRLVAADVQLQPPSHRYLTLYDTFDPAALSRAHKAAMGTPRMVVTDHHDKADVLNAYYYPLLSRTSAPTLLTPDDAPLILEQVDVPPDRTAAFERWYADRRLPALLDAPGHVAGTVLRFDPAGQMFLFEPRHSHIALYRATDLGTALAAWHDHPPAFDGLDRAVSCFVPMGPYLTRDAVAQASPDALAAEAAARRRALGHAATTADLGLEWAGE